MFRKGQNTPLSASRCQQRPWACVLHLVVSLRADLWSLFSFVLLGPVTYVATNLTLP